MDTFFGREKELTFLHKKVDDLKKEYRHNVAISGKRLSGKTFLLSHFLSTLDKTDIVPVYIDLSLLPYNALVDQFVGMMLHYNYAGKKEIGEDLQLFIESISQDLPKTYKNIKGIYSYIKANKFDSSFAELLNLPGCFSQETGKFCLIVIDNFEELANYNLSQPFSVLGDNIMLQKMSLYVLCARSNDNSKNILSEKLSLLFGKFQTLELEPFSYGESLDFIQARCGNIQLSNDIKKILISFTGGEPFYLSILTDFINTKCKDKNQAEINDEYFNYVLCDALLSAYSPINQYFSKIIEASSEANNFKAYLKLLGTLLTENKLPAITAKSKCAKDNVHKLLEKLISYEIVVKNGPLYTIEDEIFKIWIKLKEISISARFVLGQNVYNESLLSKIRQIIEAFRCEETKQIDDKILNLISAFDNEKITVADKTHILPAFKHINSEYASPENVLLSAHGSKMWVFSVFKKMADEDDIFNLINYCKQKKHRVSRKILILLADITPEAKLLAMEERMWIWPLDKLNNLLNLYRKQKIIYENSSPS